MSVILKSGSSATLADVDANKNLKVITPLAADDAGVAIGAGEWHDGLAGVAKLARPHDVTPDFRLRVGLDQSLHQDNFNHVIFNTSVYQGVTATMTIVLAGNYMSLNDGSSVASGAVARVQTYRHFPMYGTYPIYVEFWARFTLAPQTNNITEFGLGYATGTATPTDGIYFKMNSSGVLQGVVNYGGVETVATGTLPTIAANEVYHFLITMTNDRVDFWSNGVLYAQIERSTTAPGLSQSLTLPALIRHQNSGVTASAQKFQISSINITSGDQDSNRPINNAQGLMGLGGYLVPHGTTAAQIQNYANSAAPASATLSNTAAGYTTLGGQWQFAAVVGAETDYALFGYTVPAGTAAVPGRNFVITGIDISSINTVVSVGATATVMQWALGVGSTAVSLATADSATAGTRAPRKYMIGMQYFPGLAAVGFMAEPITKAFISPIISEPGTFIHIILKMPIGLATATEIFRGVASVNGYWE